MPIEEVSTNPNDKISIPAKLLDREEYWYREICSIYPYGLNDNVRRVGNVSKMIGNGLNIYSLFNKQYHKSRRRISKRRKGKGNVALLKHKLMQLLHHYKSLSFSHQLRTLLCNTSRRNYIGFLQRN